ncbi:hypothetical protein ACFE04_002237 [Oxalis oulophora]
MAKTPQFLNIVLQYSLDQAKLSLPKEFIRNYGADLQSPVVLKVPPGKIWSVGLSESDGDVWLENGFGEFIKYYSLGCGYFLLFKYEETCTFNVNIFERSAMEIQYPHNTSPNAVESLNVTDGEAQDESVVLLDNEIYERKGKSPAVVVSCERERINSTDKTERQELQGDLDPAVEKDCKANPEKKNFMPNAENFQSKHPFFLVTLTPSYISGQGQIRIPAKFARSNLDMNQANVNLRTSDGRTWPAKYCRNYNKSGITATLQNGWRKFVNENLLKVNDKCVFELIKGDEIVFNVFLFKSNEVENNLTQDISPSTVEDSSDTDGDSENQESEDDESVVFVEEIKGKSSDLSRKRKIVDSLDKPKRQRPLGNHGPTVKNDRKGKSTSSRNARMSIARNLNSDDNPSFTAKISRSYLRQGFIRVPADFARSHLDMDRAKVYLRNPNGRFWPAKYFKRHYKYGLIATLHGGWRKFVQENRLKVGDKCVFTLIKSDCKIVLNVVIIRSTRPGEFDRSVEKAGKSTGRANPDPGMKLTENASGFMSANPFFTVKIYASYLEGFIRIDSDFAQTYFKEKQGKVVLLNSDGETWPAMYRKTISNSRLYVTLHNGWNTFVRANQLKLGDECVFELINRREIMLNVRIIRSNGVENCPTQKTFKQVRHDVGDSSSKLSDSRDPEAFEDLVCSKVLPHTHLKGMKDRIDVLIPVTESIDVKFKKSEIVRLEIAGRLWLVKLYIDSHSYMSFQGGWSKFARENSLRAGDECMFKIVDVKDSLLKVSVVRKEVRARF